MLPKLNTIQNIYNDTPDGFDEIMELMQEEKRELLDMWKIKSTE